MSALCVLEAQALAGSFPAAQSLTRYMAPPLVMILAKVLDFTPRGLHA